MSPLGFGLGSSRAFGIGRLTKDLLNPLGLTIGTSYQGGYFAGYISHTQDGIPTHALIVSPKSTGQSGNLQWKTSTTLTTGSNSTFDGFANTNDMIAAGAADHPAAQFCDNLTIGGYTDWYLPSRYEADIAYFNLKPTTTNNDTTVGINPYSVPKRNSNFTTTVPSQSIIAAFQSGGSESLDLLSFFNWSSTQDGSNSAYGISFSDGLQGGGIIKTNNNRCRAFRRVAV